MRRASSFEKVLLVATIGLFAGSACSSGGGANGNTNPPVGSGGVSTGGTSSTAAGVGGASTAVPTGGMPAAGGTVGSGGALGAGGSNASGGVVASGGSSSRTGGNAGGGSSTTASGSGGSGRGGATVGSGGSGRGGATTGSGGAGTGGTSGAPIDGGTAPGGDCTMGTWPAADPAAAGPFATVIENPVGPVAGVGADGGADPQFTMFRPKDMTQGGLCHPLITWGNGTGSNPTMYKVLLNNLASHGFVVIGSNSPNVAQGNPPPMIVGVTWVLQQNDDPTSVLYHRIDTTHIGATGHSQGAMATSTASGDSHIVASVPIEGAQTQRNLHGPAMFFCGGQDTLVGCSGAQNAINAVTTLPAMFAEYVSVDHGSWMSFTGNKPSVVESVVTAWMRVHLMGDTALRSWFYGADCKLCTDSGWIITQKNMDQ